MKKINVVIAGLSAKPDEGKMARLVAEAIALQKDMELCPYGLSEFEGTVHIPSAVPMQLVPMDGHESFLKHRRGDIDLIVDFTQPKSVIRNAELYCAAGIPFVMGTTGGDREKLTETVKSSEISAVIATNMATPVVVFQEMVKFAATHFPHALDGFRLVIKESHQARKPDFSGTAMNLLAYFEMLGMPILGKEHLIKERDPVVQEALLNIPKEYLDGHGYHIYTMLSPDGTVKLGFEHDVLGRSVYVDGAMRAIRFLPKCQGTKGLVFSMSDVLR